MFLEQKKIFFTTWENIYQYSTRFIDRKFYNLPQIIIENIFWALVIIILIPTFLEVT